MRDCHEIVWWFIVEAFPNFLCLFALVEQVAAAGTFPGPILPKRHNGGAGAGHRVGVPVGPPDDALVRAKDTVGLVGGDRLEGCA